MQLVAHSPCDRSDVSNNWGHQLLTDLAVPNKWSITARNPVEAGGQIKVQTQQNQAAAIQSVRCNSMDKSGFSVERQCTRIKRQLTILISAVTVELVNLCTEKVKYAIRNDPHPQVPGRIQDDRTKISWIRCLHVCMHVCMYVCLCSCRCRPICRAAGSNPALAATYMQGHWASPSLAVACSASACKLRHTVNCCGFLAILKGSCCGKRFRNG